MTRWYVSARARLGWTLLGASVVSMGFWAAGALSNHSMAFRYMTWNLFLAWIPLLLALWLLRTLGRKPWSSWEGLLVTALWLCFLPNSFYMITDYVHIQEVTRVDLLYDVVMFTSFIFTAVTLGFVSLHVVHHELLRRLKARAAHGLVGMLLLLCSFAIYLGHDLRWNSWDILTSPGALLFDVSDRFLHPMGHPEAFSTTLTFFVLLGMLYILSRALARSLRTWKTD